MPSRTTTITQEMIGSETIHDLQLLRRAHHEHWRVIRRIAAIMPVSKRYYLHVYPPVKTFQMHIQSATVFFQSENNLSQKWALSLIASTG